jgi:hypothetical protein
VRGAAEKEIGAARRSSGSSSGVAALCTRERKEKWCGVKRRFGLAFYRAEGKVERTAEAVAATVAVAAINGGSVRWRRLGEGEGEGAVVGEWGGALMAEWRRWTGAGSRGGGAGDGETGGGAGEERGGRGRR